jgi:hypothetical protein
LRHNNGRPNARNQTAILLIIWCFDLSNHCKMIWCLTRAGYPPQRGRVDWVVMDVLSDTEMVYVLRVHNRATLRTKPTAALTRRGRTQVKKHIHLVCICSNVRQFEFQCDKRGGGGYAGQGRTRFRHCRDNTCCCSNKGVALARKGGGGVKHICKGHNFDCATKMAWNSL